MFLNQKQRSATKNFEMFFINLTLLNIVQLHNFRKLLHAFQRNLPPKGSLDLRKIWKLGFLVCSSKAKTEECEEKVFNIFNQFGDTIHLSATYFLEVGAVASSKGATKVFLSGRKNSENLSFKVIFLKQKWRSATDIFHIFGSAWVI